MLGHRGKGHVTPVPRETGASSKAPPLAGQHPPRNPMDCGGLAAETAVPAATTPGSTPTQEPMGHCTPDPFCCLLIQGSTEQG